MIYCSVVLNAFVFCADSKCYRGVGKDYNGRVNVSKTGRPCKPWIEHSAVYKFTHNYCRNFGGENYSPWCFVGNGEKEFCQISKCEQPFTGSIFCFMVIQDKCVRFILFEEIF